uniref:Uncharacterized protein n=1 Tax=Ditylenchus dipsaci TaxID=166011 RepID=A0A915EFM3_9BILA
MFVFILPEGTYVFHNMFHIEQREIIISFLFFIIYEFLWLFARRGVYDERVEIDELGCPHQLIDRKMQTGELFTFGLGGFMIVMILCVVIYYKCCEKPSRKK